MTLEERQLLLMDISARLPYGVKVQIYYEEIAGSGYFDETVWVIDNDNSFHINDRWIEDIKPYLRPMSSMTEEEKLYVELRYGFYYHDGVFDNVHIFEAGGYYDRDGNYDPPCEYREQRHITIEQVLDFIHWLNVHHFDYRGLIEKGLALEAPKDMYKTE